MWQTKYFPNQIIHKLFHVFNVFAIFIALTALNTSVVSKQTRSRGNVFIYFALLNLKSIHVFVECDGISEMFMRLFRTHQVSTRKTVESNKRIKSTINGYFSIKVTVRSHLCTADCATWMVALKNVCLSTFFLQKGTFNIIGLVFRHSKKNLGKKRGNSWKLGQKASWQRCNHEIAFWIIFQLPLG